MDLKGFTVHEGWQVRLNFKLPSHPSTPHPPLVSSEATESNHILVMNVRNVYFFRCRKGHERGVYRVLVEKPEGRRPLWRPRRRWVDNIRMDLQEVGCGFMDWIGLAQDRDRWRTLVSAVMNLRVP